MKRLFSLIFCAALLLSLSIIAFATEPDPPKVVDNASLFTDEEEAELTREAYELIERYGMDVVILTVESLEGASAQDYADDYYDYNGYREDGILFLLAMEEREWYFSTCGEAIYVFTDFGLESLGEDVLPYLSDGDYYEAFRYWQELLPHYFEAYLAGDPIDVYVPNSPGYDGREDVVYYPEDRSPDYVSCFLISLVIGAVAALVTVLIMRSRMNTARAQNDAGSYMKPGSYHLTVHRDMFLYSRVSKTPRPKDTGGSGGSHRGGSSTHRSSSGRSHGGRGGRF